MPNTYHILLTIDVEDWFQVENFKQCIPFSSWPSCDLRVEANTHRLLDLLDSQQSAVSRQRSVSTNSTNPMNSINPKNSPKATFFVLGWIAERLPHLVREIHTLIGAPVYGYRAPSFAINEDILKVIEDCGYLYDSSYNSFGMHGRYGQLDLSRNGTRGIAIQISDNRSQTNLTDSTSLRQRRIDFSAFHLERQKPKDTKSEKSCQSCLTRGHHKQSSIVNLQSSIFFELPISNLKLGNRIFQPIFSTCIHGKWIRNSQK